MFTRKFWKAAAVRAVHTVAQVAIGAIGTATLVEDVPWLAVASTTALAGILSMLKSIVMGVPEAPPAGRHAADD